MRLRIPILMLAVVLAVAGGAFARQSGDQDAPPPQGDQNASPMQGSGEQGEHMGHGGHGGGGGRMNPDQQVKMLSEKLNLTADQQTKVKSIFTGRQKQMQTLMQDQSMSREDKRAKFQQMRSDTDSQVRAVLTGNQQQKFDALLKQREQHMGGGRHNHGGSGQDQPPSNQ